MKVLILGNGAREHAIAWKLAASRRASGLTIAPGNAGTSALGTNLPDLSITDPDAVAAACHSHAIDLVFVGGEEPLSAGVVDCLSEARIPAIGPTMRSAQLESSKAFSKEFMQRNGIPTAAAHTFTDAPAFEEHLHNAKGKQVVKKSGLAAGKGVLESNEPEELIAFGRKILETDSVVVEEHLSGYEVSIFALSDGTDYLILPSAADYKKAGDGNTGPNTGGMGALSPVPWLEATTLERIRTEVVAPTFRALKEEGLSYRGVLYFGLMITHEGPRVLEYNVRFGDPETQVVLPLIQTDFGALCHAMVTGGLRDFPLHITDKTALGVVVASEGYPGEYRRDVPVSSLPEPASNHHLLFHAATKGSGGNVRTGGGRCFTAVGLGKDLIEARTRAYAAVEEIRFEGAWYRSDIGGRLFE